MAIVCAVAAAVPYTVPTEPWPETFGLHRAVIRADEPADAILIRLPWRRRDDPTRKRIIATTEDGTGIPNVFRVSLDRESAVIVAGPVAAGTLHVYYRPYPVQPGWGNYVHDYLPPEAPPDAAWTARNGLAADTVPAGLPEARLVEFQARTAFDDLSPMGVPLTAGEQEALLRALPDAPMVLFPEDRRFPIRMPDALPVRWAAGPSSTFSGTAQRNEYYAFQIGVLAPKADLPEIAVTFGPLRGAERTLPPTAMTCFNTGGIDCYGVPFTKTVDVPAGRVQALWCGIDLPRDIPPGTYAGTVTVAARGVPPQTVNLDITVADEILEDRGDGDLWRHARLRWLNSTRGIADTPVAPYTPMTRDGRAVHCLGRTVTVADSGLPAAIETFGRGVLAGPVRFVTEGPDGAETAAAGIETAFVSESEGSVVWESTGTADGLGTRLEARMEFDGHTLYRLTLTPSRDMSLGDARLEIPFTPGTGRYMMGMGRPGGEVPDAHDWKWQGPFDSFWVGDAGAGIHCELRGSTYHGPMLNLYHPPPPPTWHNGGRGGCRIARTADAVTATAYTGPFDLREGVPITFEFALLVTPVKPLDPERQFRERYFHHIEPKDEDVAAGIRIVNVHHANRLNPFINYPFVATDTLRTFVEEQHDRGLKVKIYYTLRELTNHVFEIWALRSLGHEVLAGGGGGGYPWLREHLESDYLPQWYQHFDDGTVCAAIANSGESRWYNYYVEGLAWVMQNVGIDGLYLDDVSYDRRILKRMRRVMAESNPDCRIDLHSNTGFSIGPAMQYAEFFPYVDKLWFGESFQYDRMSPSQWLVETAGIPFGLMGDMLQGGGNRWLGMVYGMTARMPWTDAPDPRPVWRLWDEFGIGEARMVGWWEDDCPVRTDDPQVLATAYVRPGRTLVAIGNWAPERRNVRLRIDWQAIGLDPERTVVRAPAIANFQPASTRLPDDTIPVPSLKGQLLILEEGTAPAEAGVTDEDTRGLSPLLAETFAGETLGEAWTAVASPRPGTSLTLRGGALEIEATAHSCAFIERTLPAGVRAVECRIHTGTDAGESWGSGLLLAWPDRQLRINLRANEGRCGVDDGTQQLFGGSASPGRPHRLRILLDADTVRLQVNADDWMWETVHTVPRSQYPGDPVALKVGKMDAEGRAVDHTEPGRPGTCRVEEVRVFGRKTGAE